MITFALGLKFCPGALCFSLSGKTLAIENFDSIKEIITDENLL
jgi:hypothetical protein